jgi:hypothetical protein
MACGEPALAITGFFFAHEVCLSERPWAQRALRLLPYALIALGWIAFWKLNDYGTAGPGFYVDPTSTPWEFLAHAVYRFPAYLVGQLFLPPGEVFALLEGTEANPLALVGAWALAVLLGWLFLPLLRVSRLARFFALGMLVATLLICGSVVVGRALWYVGFGASGLLALYLERLRDPQVAPQPARLAQIFAGVMLALHLWLSPLLFIGYGKSVDVLDVLMDAERVHLPDHGDAGRSVLALSVKSHVVNITFPMLKDEALSLGAHPTRPAPDIARIRALNDGEDAYDLLRSEADTLVIRRATGFTSLRPPEYGFDAGDRIGLDDVTVLIPSVTAQRAPTVIEYRFKPGTLDKYQVIAWRDGRFVDAALPAVGQTLHVGGAD